ncbi:TetR family transcriptional regulator [Nocardioides sp. YIM 152588]|uniref:TetR/AcrR family transcriptional regulator n=1 Tax=Nocardioides sp. YIM 152588 TaxID=3158259 RepID=UPI0032E3E161
MRSATPARPPDLTAKATIREVALGLFAERGADAVTVREIAGAAGVSPALVLHHFGSKDGLRAAVDEAVAATFEDIVDALGEAGLEGALTDEGAEAGARSLGEAFAASFPPGSPIPGYLRRLLLSGDPTGDRIFARWFELSERLLADLEAAGVARPSGDRPARAAFLLVNDLAAVLLAPQLASTCGIDLLTPDGMSRWAEEATDVYARGAFRAPDPEEGSADE